MKKRNKRQNRKRNRRNVDSESKEYEENEACKGRKVWEKEVYDGIHNVPQLRKRQSI